MADTPFPRLSRVLFEVDQKADFAELLIAEGRQISAFIAAYPDGDKLSMDPLLSHLTRQCQASQSALDILDSLSDSSWTEQPKARSSDLSQVPLPATQQWWRPFHEAAQTRIFLPPTVSVESPNTNRLQYLQQTHESLREQLIFADGEIWRKSNQFHTTLGAQVSKRDILRQCFKLYQVTHNMLKERNAKLQQRAEQSEALAAVQREELCDLRRQIAELQSLSTVTPMPDISYPENIGLQAESLRQQSLNLSSTPEHAAFNQKLLDNELSPAWALVFTQGRTNVTFPMHLMSIIMKLQPAANKGSLQSINAANISPDDPKYQTSKVYQKGYVVPNNTVTSDHPISDNRWWEDFHQRYVAVAMQRANQERMVKEEELAQRQRKEKEKEEAKQVTAAMQAVTEELVRKKKAKEEEERKKAKETKKKKAAPTQAKKQVEKQVEKWAREVDTEESEDVEEDAARTPSRASKRVKRTPSEDDGRPHSDKDEAEPNLLDAFYDLPCNNCTAQDIRCRARLYNSKKWTSCVFCRGRKQGCTTLMTFPAIKTSTNKVLHAANSWQDLVMRGRPVTKGKRLECSKSRTGRQIARAGTAAPEDIHMQSPKGPKATKAKKGKETHVSPDAMDEDQPSDEEPKEDELAMRPKGQKAKKVKSKGKETRTLPDAMDEDSPSDDDHEELQALVPMVDKGKGRELPLPSLAPAPSLVPVPSQGEVDIVETRTTTLVQQMAKQLTDMQGWDTASNEIDQIADAEDIQHLVLKAWLADSEQERKVVTTESAQARHIITSLQSMYAGMSQFIQFSSNVGGTSGVPPSVLSSQPPSSQ
ncbi:hypothetical protein PAXINDRAFT_18012 [Paxillus involutus ATCC 200175]|uniref:Unplaced genomic scaffold PAXINscaffold_217, whole genome shotgun sequence n=1 Tax=Paxillus involutus ATCC 200175 TaxID=664439 RepID=A0A0C9SPD5_PAXIN|nr:hypothetical protein PAXINDRAFT_18012 [Paxillus involutus ATCC 200175]